MAKKKIEGSNNVELKIGPATPIGRGNQPISRRGHTVARGIVQTVSSLLPFGATSKAITSAQTASRNAATARIMRHLFSPMERRGMAISAAKNTKKFADVAKKKKALAAKKRARVPSTRNTRRSVKTELKKSKYLSEE